MQIARFHEEFLELPLFQGMTRSDLNEVILTVKPAFMSCSKGRVIIQEGSLCDRLCFLSGGKMAVSVSSDDRAYTLTEELSAPDIIQPECVFGLTQRFTRTVSAAEGCELISIGKQDVVRLSDRYEIFRLNLLNIISTRTQRVSRVPLRAKPQGVRQKVVRFVENRCIRPAGRKILSVTMERLAAEIGESRLNLSRELNAMNAEGLIELSRAEIVIPALERVR